MDHVDADPARYLTITGVLLPDNRLLLQPGYLTDRPEYAAEDPRSPIMAELADDGGQVLLRYRVPASPPCNAEHDMAQLLVAGKVPFPKGTRRVLIYRGDVLIHEIQVPRSGPVVRLTWEVPRVVTGRRLVSWTGEHPDGRPLSFIVSYSHTEGRTWLPLNFSSPRLEQEVDFDSLPGGERCQIAVTASDGVNTVTVASEPFSAPIKPCLAMILSPGDGATFELGEAVPLRGQGYYREERRAETERLTWNSSLDGEICTGPYCDVQNLSSGEHRITLTAGTEDRQGRATVGLRVKD
jgi:hypothetical protein